MSKTVAHFGTFDVPNYGDLLFPLILEKRLGHLVDRFIHVSPRGGPAVWSDCVPSQALQEFMLQRPKIDALVVGGGNIIHCSPTALEAYRNIPFSGVFAYPSLWLNPAWLSATLQLPLWWNGSGVSQAVTSSVAPVAQWACSSADYLAVRDSMSQNWLHDAGVRPPVQIIPDTALEIAELWPAHEIRQTYELAFIERQRELPQRTVVFHLNNRFLAEPLQVIADRLDRICKRFRSTGILIALGPCHGDSKLQQDVGNLMQTRPLIIEHPRSLREIAACCAHSEAYIGSSLHGLITACSYGRRCMSVVSSQSGTAHKFTGFLEQFQLSGWINDSWETAEARAGQLCDASPSHWQRILEAARPLLQKHWQRVELLLSEDQQSAEHQQRCLEKQRALSSLNQLLEQDGIDGGPLQLLVRENSKQFVGLRQESRTRAEKINLLRRANEKAEFTLKETEEKVRTLQQKIDTEQKDRQAGENFLKSRILDETRISAQQKNQLEAVKKRLAQVEEKLSGETAKRKKLEGEYQERIREINSAWKGALTELGSIEENLKQRESELTEVRNVHEQSTKDSDTKLSVALQEAEQLKKSLTISENLLEQSNANIEKLVGEQEARNADYQTERTRLQRANAEFQTQLSVRDYELQQLRAERISLDRKRYSALLEKEKSNTSQVRTALRQRDEDLAYVKLIMRIRDEIDRHIPVSAQTTIISRGDDQLINMGRRKCFHFPADAAGNYLGYHPASSAEAVELLERQQQQGTRYLVIPNTSFWWLQHYADFKAHLGSQAICLVENSDYLIYSLPRASLVNRTMTWFRNVRFVRAAEKLPDRSNQILPVDSHPLSLSDAPPPPDTNPSSRDDYPELVRRVLHAVDQLVPPNSVVSVISKGDDQLLHFANSRGWHFPQTDQGLYAGFYPASDAEAIDHLENQKRLGAQYLVIPTTSAWWLDHYAKLRDHLENHHKCEHQDESCRVYGIATKGTPSSRQRAQLSAAGELKPSRNGTDPSTHRGETVSPDSQPKIPRFSPQERPLDGKLITVIVPIYNAQDAVKKCLESLVQHHRHAHHVLLIDDCSPDARIVPLLESFAERHAFIRILRNEENLGFTKTVNRACRAALGDVVILNSDTQVTEGWLEKLDACAHSSDKVGTVTPLSNAAGAFSVPKNNFINEIPRSLTVDDMGQIVDRHSKRIRPNVPTGNGFCMFISRNLLNAIGYFDEAQFPRGYGEENDFCMRAKAKGFINLIDDATFIYHHLSASFGASRRELIAKSRETLRRLHPSYKEEVTQWLKNDPLDGFRTELESYLRSPQKPASRVQPDKPCLLYVIHDGKGGTPLTNADLIRGIEEDHRCLLLTTGLDHWNLLEPKDGSFQPLRRYRFKEQWRLTDPMNEERLQVLEEISREYHVDLVHVRHLLGSGPEVVDHFHRSKIPVIFSFHDYYTVCPTIQLIDREDTYCQGKCTSGEQDCRVAPSWFRGKLPRLKHDYVHLHRKKMKAAIEKCDFLVTTCHSAKDVIEQAFPEVRRKQIQVIEHGRDIDRESLAVPPSLNEPAKIVCLGNIDHAKGSKAISELLAINQRAGNPFEFHFLGMHATGFRPGEAGGIYHGRYKREELSALLGEIRPSFSLIASIWAETYCHTLTESWGLGIPVFASHFGALKERVDRHGGGWLIDPGDPEKCFKTMLEIKNSPACYAEAIDALKRMPERSIAAMVNDYRQIYLQCLNKK